MEENNGLDRYTKVLGTGTLKPQQRLAHNEYNYSGGKGYNNQYKNHHMFASPIPVNNKALLQQAPSREQHPVYPYYLSPQRDYGKAKKLLDSNNDENYFRELQPPIYKIKQGPYTSLPRRVAPMNYNYFSKTRTSHGLAPAQSYPEFTKEYKY